MMRDLKILDDKHISWSGNENARLNYQMIFEECEKSNSDTFSETEEVDLEALIHQTNLEWENKLEKARKEAFSEGLQKGKEQGFEQAGNEIEEKISTLKQAFTQAHSEWRQRQEFLEPGLLDLVFDISESILGIPVSNPAIREKLDRELDEALREIDEEAKTQLWVSESDYQYVEKLANMNIYPGSINIQISKECNPGEFKLENNRETIIHNFRVMLKDFKESLSLPSWK
ncbi:MAG TPA: FliH/SctL family protein [Halalkalibaculum sp.]|nr:FliH/SctL family protein [Halalkalibaculum sp.]